MYRKQLTEGYRKEKAGKVVLSGKSYGFEGVAAQWLSDCFVNNRHEENLSKADVRLLPVDDTAKQIIRDTFDIEYKENDEGYIIDIDDTITVYANNNCAALFAVATIVDTYHESGVIRSLNKGVIYNYPDAPHRAARVYLPAKKDMDYFKKFIDMLVYMGYNTLWLEIGGAMEFKKHPEINEAWLKYCVSMQEYHKKPYIASRGYYRTKNSIHTYNGGGEIYSQDEMRDLAKYCDERNIEIIPEVPSLTHSEYFLLTHPHLKECADEPYAATACPSHPELYPLVFDLYDEVIDVFNPKTIHIGHDEWWVMCVCDRCKGKDPARLFADNVIKCYNYLKERGVKTMMWSDKTIRTYEKTGEAQGGCEKHLYSLKTDELVDVLGEKYPVYKRFWMADLAPEEAKRDGFHQIILDTADCMDMLPKDIIHVNWLWACEPQINDEFLKRNLEMVYGNLDMTGLWDCKERFALGAKGISISNWIESDEKGFQHWDALFMLAYGATQCWGHTRKPFEYERIVFDAFEQLYRFRNREILKGKYLEVVHTTEDSGAEGKKFYETPYVPDKDMYLGKYVVSYTDNTTEEIPVLYAHNISCRDASTDWYSSPRFWGFLTDNRLTVAISVCNIEKRPDGIWYKAVFPVKGEIASCKYVPCEGGEDFVTVDKMTYKNAETGEEKPF